MTTRTTVITGASSGIGREFARRFAERGEDLVLVARRLPRLEALAAQLRLEYGVAVTPIALDLAEPGRGAELQARMASEGLVVGGLVNCAGFGKSEPFADADPIDVAAQINVDVAALVDLTKTFYSDLLTAESGLLINVASMAGYAPFPGMAVYAAAKAFVISFTEALWVEARSSRLRVLCVSPGATTSEFFEISQTSSEGIRFQTPAQVVETTMRELSSTRRRPTVVSGRSNAVLAQLSRGLPRSLVLKIASRMSASAADSGDPITAGRP